MPRGAGRSQRRHRAGDQRPAQEGAGRGREEGAARNVGRTGRLLHSRGRKDWRARGNQLRERFRGAHRRFPAAVPRRGDAHRRARSAISAARGSDPGDARPRARNLSRAGQGDREARAGDRKDRHRQDGKILRRELPLRAALHQGRRHHGEGAGRSGHRQGRREYRHPPLFAIQGGRNGWRCAGGRVRRARRVRTAHRSCEHFSAKPSERLQFGALESVPD